MRAISSSVTSTRTQITSHLLNLGCRSLPDFTMLEHAGLEATAGKAFERLEPRVAGKVSWLVTSKYTNGLGLRAVIPLAFQFFTGLYLFRRPAEVHVESNLLKCPEEWLPLWSPGFHDQLAG
jgi:hypothetical protein